MLDEHGGIGSLICKYDKGDIIFRTGDFGHHMYIVHSGSVTLFAESENGERTEIRSMQPGDFFGEMALVDSSPRSLGAMASEAPTQLICLDRDKFLFLICQMPVFALAVMHTLCERIRDLTNK